MNLFNSWKFNLALGIMFVIAGILVFIIRLDDLLDLKLLRMLLPAAFVYIGISLIFTSSRTRKE